MHTNLCYLLIVYSIDQGVLVILPNYSILPFLRRHIRDLLLKNKSCKTNTFLENKMLEL